MGSALQFVIGLAAMSGGAFRLAKVRRRRSPSAVFLAWAVIAVGTSAAFSTHVVLAVAAQVEPSPNIARLVANVFGMVAAWCIACFSIHLSTDDTARARLAVCRQAMILVVTVAVMTALFLSSDTTYRPDFLAAYGHMPGVFGYVLLFSGYVAWCLLTFIYHIRRYIELTDRPWLQTGIRFVWAGATFGVAWAVNKMAAASAVFAHGVWIPFEDVLVVALPSVCVLLVVIGIFVPAVGPRATRLRTRMRHRRAYRALRPLWFLLAPVIAKVEPVGDAPAVEGRITIEEQLNRRVVGIFDALLYLAPYRHSADTISPYEYPGRPNSGDPDTHIEAASILEALRRWHAGEPRRTGVPPAPKTPLHDLDAATSWLASISRELRHLPSAPPIAAANREDARDHR